MQLSTLARDCLVVNWALPLSTAPELPHPLRYEVHSSGGQEWVFTSALHFRLSGLRLESLPFARVSYPQMSLRLYVLDGDGLPSVLFWRTLVPFWIAPLSLVFAGQGASAASFNYPSPSADPGAGEWRWSVERRRKVEVWGRMASPWNGRGPSLGSWEKTVDYFHNRRRGYAMWDDRLRSLRSSHPKTPIWPLEVEIAEAGLLGEYLDEVPAEIWEAPHSAWLCPEIPFHFELGKPMTLPIPSGRRVPAAEGLSSSGGWQLGARRASLHWRPRGKAQAQRH